MSLTPQKLLAKLRRASRLNLIVAVLAGVAVAIAGYTLIASQAATVRTSTKSGNWSDASVWGGTVPQPGEAVVIAGGHNVIFDQTSYQAAGLTIDGTLTFDPAKSTTLNSSANVIVNGKLVMRPNTVTIIHKLKFTGINEANFVGGGLDPISGDIGLWVMGAGQLDLQGARKSGWLRLSGNLNPGGTSATLESAPTGWVPGDEIVVTPTEKPSYGRDNLNRPIVNSESYTHFDTTTLASVSGSTIGLSQGASFSHAKVNGKWGAEVANLTRNVQIEGGSATSGRAHVFIRSSSPQVVNYASLRYLGPRKNNDIVLGRYGLHFHVANNGSRGSQVFGTVVRDLGSHGFVPHKSHGVWFKDTVAYNTQETPYWWDHNAGPGTIGDETHDTLYDHALAARSQEDGFALAQGARNSVRDSVAAGITKVGFVWPETSGSSNDSTVWEFTRGNIAHNNGGTGFFVWQNHSEPHVVANFVLYHNGDFGIQHGAYLNNYHYENSEIYGNLAGGVRLQAVSFDNSLQLRFDNVVFDGADISDYLVTSDDHNISGVGQPTVFRNSTFKGSKTGIFYIAGGENEERNLPDNHDLEFPTIQAPDVYTFDSGAPPENNVRVQTSSNTATLITRGGRTSIAPFAPAAADHDRPQISVAAPASGEAITGTVDFRPYIYEDFAGVDRVELFIDDVRRATSSTSPYTVSFNTQGLGDGMHMFQLRVFDKLGKSTASHITSYWVYDSGPVQPPTPPANDTTRPNIELYTPTKNEAFSGYYQITSLASDNFGISKVEYYFNNTLIGTDNTAPFDGILWNTYNSPNASKASLTAKAYDFSGNTDTATSIDLTLQKTGTPPPAPTPPPPASPPPPPPAPLPPPPPPPPPSGKLGDLNGDNNINILDLSILLSNWNRTVSGVTGDLNGDGVVNILDLSILLSRWGT